MNGLRSQPLLVRSELADINFAGLPAAAAGHEQLRSGPHPGHEPQGHRARRARDEHGAWVYRLGRRCAADFIALLDQLLQAFPHAPAIVVICDNDSIHHARKVTAYLERHPRLELLYGARYSPNDNPAERI